MSKLYSDYIDELSPDDIFEGLLGHGLFFDKLPKCLSSESFLDYCKKANPSFNSDWHQYIVYQSNRNNGAQRVLGIPTPMSYYNLCKTISDNWVKLQKHFRDKTSEDNIKKSRIHIRRIHGKKSLFEMNYSSWRLDGTPKLDFMTGAKYVVSVDISQCFQSIYTHSLTWALVGKDHARSNINGRNWFNKIDRLTAATKDGQTHGLLIGPHAYNLLSEIILCDIDNSLSKHWKYVRYIDDYTCYVGSYEEAQKFIRELAKNLRKYDLFLNDKKTKIEKLPVALQEHWIRELNYAFIETSANTLCFTDIRNFLDLAIDLYNETKNASIFNYAFKMIAGTKLSRNAETCYKKYAFSLALLHPYLIPILGDCLFKKVTVYKPELNSFLNSLYSEGLENQNYEQSAFSLYYALMCGIEIENFMAKHSIESEDCIFLLFSYLYSEQTDNQEAFSKLYDSAKTLNAGKSSDFDRLWLFAYEILDEKDLKDEWKEMKKNKVTFVNKKWKNRS